MDLILAGIDRDGTINWDYDGFFGKESDWREKLNIYPGVVEAIKLLNQNIKIVILHDV
jgi:histidinol phosphatase-like enzyme